VTADGLLIGERVTVTVFGARVEEVQPDPGGAACVVLLSYGPGRMVVDVAAPAVAVQRVAPPQWPPLPGDVWEDRDGVEWFCRLIYTQDATEASAELVCAVGGQAYRLNAEDLLDRCGPMRLRRRRGLPAGEIAEIAAGTRLGLAPTAGQLLGLIERGVREDGLPCPKSTDIDAGLVQLILPDGQAAAVEAWARYLALDPPERTGPALGTQELSWQQYQAAAERLWPHWAVVVWCSVPAGPVIEVPPAGAALPTAAAPVNGIDVADAEPPPGQAPTRSDRAEAEEASDEGA